jgi:Tol biopolymer transport system component
MLFHNRITHAGTILINEGQIVKLNTKTPDNISAAVYPRWHPAGRYIAFSTNKTSQAFHSVHENLVEVYDSASDLIIFDTENQSITSYPLIHSPERFETFPEWSPDGKSIYFCSANAVKMPANYDSLRYDLYRIDFDPVTGKTGNQIDTIFQPSKMGKSIAFPRISPNGRYMTVCLSNFGTFPIWHKENDLYLLDLQTGDAKAVSEINSAESDSYHSWSSNGRWLIFSSRRMDGLYTRLYFAYFDSDGNFHKPFLLPQKNPLLYDCSLKSYNVPEFISGKIKINIRLLERIIKIDYLCTLKNM